MFDPTRTAALKQLEHFLPRAGQRYTRSRNFDRGAGAHHNVSGLSPWLRHRVLLETEVLAAVLERHTGAEVEKFIDEIFWRAYFRGWLAQHPGVWRAYKASVEAGYAAAEANRGLAAALADAEAGKTGNAAFDHWARELVETGYLHNHARMWFASIWVFTLRLPWALGADFFLRYLLDGDPASNTLSWRWVSGLHTRGKTYLARRDNILRFTDGRLDPGSGLAPVAEPLTETELPEKTALSWPAGASAGLETGAIGTGAGAATGHKLGRTTRQGWLVTDEDVRLEATMPADGVPLAGLAITAGRSPGEVSATVHAFSKGCVADACRRRDQPDATCFDEHTISALAAWAEQQGLQELGTMFVPYGPTADALNQLEPLLGQAGIGLRQHVRPYDRLVWPHAGRGFFPLRKRIPRLLEALELAEPVVA
ncbi:MAG: FAD-binding domain-containing protein [Pseudomonadota bacterium]